MGFVDDSAAAPSGGAGRFVDEPTTPKSGKFVDEPAPPQAQAPTPAPIQQPQAQSPLAPVPQQGAPAHDPGNFPNPLAGAYKAANSAFLNAQVNARHMIQAPLNALDAVFGAAQRYSSGVLTYSHTDDYQKRFAGHSPLDKIEHGAIQATIGHGIDVAAHPFDERKQGENIKATMSMLGFDKLDAAYNAVVNKEEQFAGKTPVIGKAFVASGEAAKGAVRLLTVLASQAITDPTMIAGPLSQSARAARALETIQHASRVADVAQAASKGAHAVLKATGGERVFKPLVAQAQTVGKKALQGGRWIFGRRPELNEFLDDTGKAGRLGIEQKIDTGLGKNWRKADDELVLKHEQAIKDADKALPGTDPYPPELRQRLQKNAWRFGTADMRTKLEAEGYKPGKDDFKVLSDLGLGHAPPGILDFNVVSKYVPKIKGKSSFAEEYDNLLQSLDRRYGKDTKSPFEKMKKGEGFKDDPIDVMNRRLGLERYIIQRRLVDKETEEFLTKHGGWIGQGAPDAKKLTHEANPFLLPTGTPQGFELNKITHGSELGRMGAQAIVANPLPHGKNLAELAFLSGGAKAFGRGVAYASKGLDETQLTRLQNMGGLPGEYAANMRGPIGALARGVSSTGAAGKAVVGAGSAYAHGTNAVLDRIELGMRQALLDHYDEMLGPSASIADEYKKADLIRRDLGDYRNVSLFVKALQSIGGPFVAFRIGTVPAAVGRAALKNPGRVEALARPEVDLNEDPELGGRAPFDVHLGGPVDDFAKLTAQPVADLSMGQRPIPSDYLGSPATLGLLGGRGDESAKEGFGESLRSAVGSAAEQYIPGVSLLEPVIHAYGATPGISLLHSMLLEAFGGYVKKKPNARYERAAEKRMRNAQ